MNSIGKIIAIILSSLCSAAFAQIPNASFENWTAGAPEGWAVTSVPANTTVTMSTDAYAGSYALGLNVVSLGGINTTGGAVLTGGKSGYFQNSGNFLTLTGWYVLNMAAGGDELFIYTGTKCSYEYRNSTGTGNYFMDSNTGVYKEFILPLNYTNGCTSDSASIGIEIVNFSTYNPSVNSWAIVDDLSLGIISGIGEAGNNVTLENAFPNPASYGCTIIYSIPYGALVNIELFDISGRRIKTLLNDTYQTAGRYKIPVNVTDLTNGIYIYKAAVNGQVYSQRLTVER